MARARAGGQSIEGACEPTRDCARCTRLVAFREASRAREPTWHNAPVPSFGGIEARALIVGLAPGFRGANRTGRPFTGDFAGDLLYSTLLSQGLAEGEYSADPGDGLVLRNVRITNAVRCVPPENKPTTAEIGACREFLAATIRQMPNLAVILVLGRIAHASTVAALGIKASAVPFAHGARHEIRPGLVMYASYHCSRYNTQTRRLTTDMFEDVVARLKTDIGA